MNNNKTIKINNQTASIALTNEESDALNKLYLVQAAVSSSCAERKIPFFHSPIPQGYIQKFLTIGQTETDKQKEIAHFSNNWFSFMKIE